MTATAQDVERAVEQLLRELIATLRPREGVLAAVTVDAPASLPLSRLAERLGQRIRELGLGDASVDVRAGARLRLVLLELDRRAAG